jgi:glycosyltransferase involved in cell wall biosynthesis
MPTSGRPAFALNAVRLFLAQDYPNRELVVVMDRGADDELASALPADPRIRCLYGRPGESIGAKRNRACEIAMGGYVAQWDDDDWYGPRRLSVQLEPLLAGRADVTAMTTPIFLELPAWRFWGVTPWLHRRLFVQDVHGGTLVYRREVWERLARYPDASLAEDAQFLTSAKRRGARLQPVPGEGLFMYVRHGANAWNFTCGEHGASAGWYPLAEPPLTHADHAFYRARCAAAKCSDPPGSQEAGDPTAGRRRSANDDGETVGDRAPVGGGEDAGAHRGGVAACAAARLAGEASGMVPDDGMPLVTCIMPTNNRRDLVGRAVAYFGRQDYPNRELIVVDDGDEPVGDIVSVDQKVRYVRLDRRLVLGEKRNLACELARGSVIVHWDDDDWYAAHRISYQLGQLEQQRAELCGLSRLLYFEPATAQAWLYSYPATTPAGWLAGSGLCYRIEAWRKRSFEAIDVGEDTAFVRDRLHPAAVVIADHRFLVGIIHGANSNPKLTASIGWQPRPAADIRALLGADYEWYVQERAIGREGVA